MIFEGVILMCIGMGVVFLFLALLVAVTSQTSRLVRKYEQAAQEKR